MLARRALPLLLVGVAAFGMAAQNEHSKAFWVKKYNGIAKMFATKNMAAFEATLDPKFFYTDDKGVNHSRSEFIKNEVEPIKLAKSVGGTVKVTAVKATKDEVAVSYDWKYWMVAASPKGDMEAEGEEIGTDHWHKVKGTWLTTRTVIKKSMSSEEMVAAKHKKKK